MSAVVPPHHYEQFELTELFADLCLGRDTDRGLLDALHRNAKVDTRSLALPKERYADLGGFGAANDEFLEVGVELGCQAVTEALDAAGLRPTDVDLVISTTVTGIAAPSLEARMAGRLGLRQDVRRVPLFGLGCVAGASGVARLHDYLVGHPDQVAVLVSVELCSLTVQRDDRSMANMVASGLFGDGASAVVAVGADRDAAGPQVVDSRSHLYPDSLRTMGWDVSGSGLRLVLDPEVPTLVEKYLADDVRGLLADHGLRTTDIATWISHPGGPKVIEAIERSLDLPEDALEMTWRSLARVGNLSSSSVLHVFHDTLAEKSPDPGSYGLLLAMGPGFCSELVLLRW